MDLAEALDIQVGRTKLGRLRELCDDSQPDREVWRARVIAEAQAPWPPVATVIADAAATTAAEVETPSLLTRIAAATTAAFTFVVSGFETLDAESVAARLAVCSTCDQRTPGGLCSGCGCWLDAKARLPHEDCPLAKWPRSGSELPNSATILRD